MVTMIGDSSRAIEMNCPNCDSDVSLLPPNGGSGTYAMDSRGWVTKVRRAVKTLDQVDDSTLNRLHDEVTAAADQRDQDAATAALERAGLGFMLDRDSRMEIWAILAIIVPVILTILTVRAGKSEDDHLTPDEVDHVCQTVMSETSKRKVTREGPSGDEVTVTTSTKVQRNVPCPCGSGVKYKRCHGQHPSIPREEQP